MERVPAIVQFVYSPGEIGSLLIGLKDPSLKMQFVPDRGFAFVVRVHYPPVECTGHPIAHIRNSTGISTEARYYHVSSAYHAKVFSRPFKLLYQHSNCG